MVFQSYALYPHMSVFENMALPLTMARLNVFERIPLVRLASPRRNAVMAQIAGEVKAVAEQLRIESLFARRPGQLSGGQRQRVALGRAMVRHPDVFLMDEPLSNLDAKLRVHMRSELAELHARLGVTMVYVTHDQVEAMTMADRLAVMDQGVILQLGTPSEVYERPASVTVAQFIGSPGINLLPGKVGANGVVEIATAALPLRVEAPAGSALTIGVRPESIHVRPQPGDGRVACRFHRRENLGSESILHFDVPGVENLKLLAKVAHGEDGAEPQADGPAEVGFAPAHCHVFDAGGQRLATETHGPAARSDGRAAIAMGHAQ
jgi:multiple sugar transport system ATP-binding protein